MKKYKSIKDIKMKIPEKVEYIISKLEESGFEAFAVGGCVRDTLLGRKPQDWDITTSALPLQVKELFSRTVDTGLRHGTVTVMMNKTGYEVTTYRIDGEYTDSRHPESVEFTSNLIEDLQRRDFTINAMAYNHKTGLIDAFDGIGDIKRKLIKCVGEAQERFSEDALRILRTVRFSAQLGFEIEQSTQKAAKKMAQTLENISAERIRTELEKIILSNNPDKLIDAYNAGITKVIFPEFDAMMECPQETPYHKYNVGVHTIKVMENVPPERILRWAALLHDIAKPDVFYFDTQAHFKKHAIVGVEKSKSIMKRLKMDNKTINTVARLVECHDDRPAEHKQSPQRIRRSVKKIGKDIYPLYLQLAAADFAGKSDYGKKYGYEGYQYTVSMFNEIIEKNQATSINELDITGKEIIAMGYEPGPYIGEILNYLIDRVIENPDYNKKSDLVKFVKGYTKAK